jgi:two-component system OmpR family sensor kinase
MTRAVVQPLRQRVREPFRSLTSRLVLTAVALVLTVSVVIGVVASLAVRTYLDGRLDDDVQGALDRARNAPAWAYVDSASLQPPEASGDGRTRPDPRFGQGESTLTAYFGDFADYDAEPNGTVVDRGGRFDAVPEEDLDVLAGVGTDARPRTVDLPELGSYRVAATETAYGVVVAGLPTDDVDDAVATLLRVEAVLVLGGAGLAALVGLLLVRRQLRPLTEVAATAHRVSALPLDSGEIDLADRVPERLTDERTEVGQVGAALNTLLAHVESSLTARHRSEQQVRQFVADASHELRTPLATIAGYTELAQRRPEDTDTQRTALGKVAEESVRMTGLVEDLLLLARLDSGRPLVREPVDLTRLLLEAVSDARVLAPSHHWRLELPEDVVEVVGDTPRLHQVVTNLLTNARKHTPEGSTITVAATATGFTVHDDGPGFDPDLADRAFERFVRGDVSRARGGQDPGGAGLGLSLVQAIVAAHGGSVTLSSRPGDTTIEVRLPVSTT